MDHSLFAVFPLPIVLAFALLVLLLVAVTRVLARLGQHAPVRTPAREPQQAARERP